MGSTLSPFRYIQMARYVLHRWIDSAPLLAKPKGKGKQRAVASTPPTRSLLLSSVAGSGAPDRKLEEKDQAGPSKLHMPTIDNGPDPRYPPESKEIYRLMNDARLFIPGAIKPPREIVVLCHGLYGFSTATPIPLFPSLKLHYWASVLEVLRDRMGVKVVVVGVKGTGSIEERANQMHEFLKNYLPKGTGVNFVAHSMGGLDCRHLISTIRPTTYTPLSLTTIGTPHRGSPFMDWCAANIGVGSAASIAKAAAGAAGAAASKMLPYSLKSPLLGTPSSPSSSLGFPSFFTSYLLNIFDSPAYGNLTTSYLRDHFNPSTPDSDAVKYISVSGRVSKISVLHPLWFPKLVLDSAAENGYAEDNGNTGKEYEGNDGLVSVSSAKWGEFMGTVDGCHHWDLRGEGGVWPSGGSVSTKPEGKPDKAKDGGWDFAGNVDSHLGLINEKNKKKSEAEITKEKEQEKEKESSWDLAQVGQVVDWVSDLLPGDGPKNAGTGTRQMRDAQREKERDEAKARGDATREPERKGTDERKNKKEKFDLGRFYGGLMIKLREEGF
ncbi:triacylglycerol lipase, partial [Tremellales sp. Uapishka_1]